MKKTIAPLIILMLLFSLFVSLDAVPPKKKKNQDGSLKKGTPEYYLNQGLFYLNAGNLTLAEKRLKKALAKDEGLAAAVNGLGIIYLQRRKFDTASQYFRQVIQLNPKYYDAYNYLGVIFSETGKYLLAKENFLMAANAEDYRTPENAYSNLAMLEVSQNNMEEAMKYVRKGLAANKSFAILYNVKGIIHEKQKNYERAVYCFDKALSLLTEDDISILINLGRTYSKMGRKNRAVDVLEKAYSKAYTPKLKVSIREMIDSLEKKPGSPGKVTEAKKQ